MAFAAHLRAIGDAGLDIQRRQAGVLFEQFLWGRPRGKKVEDKRHPDARPFDAGLAEANPRVDRDAVQQFFLCWHTFHPILTTKRSDAHGILLLFHSFVLLDQRHDLPQVAHHGFEFCDGLPGEVLRFGQFIPVLERFVLEPRDVELVAGVDGEIVAVGFADRVAEVDVRLDTVEEQVHQRQSARARHFAVLPPLIEGAQDQFVKWRRTRERAREGFGTRQP